MQISIITITRNNAAGLRRTLASVAAQSHAPIQHIIVDGCSSDGSDAVIADYIKAQSSHGLNNSFSVITATDNGSGVYNAINTGLTMATGDVIGLLHAGDVYAGNDVLSRVAGEFDGEFDNGAVDFLYGDIHYGDASGRLYSGRRASARSLLRGFAPPHPSLFVRAAVQGQVGLYKPDYVIGADFDMFVRLMAVGHYRGRYVPLDMVHMQPGGLASRWRHRLWTNNSERLRALRENGLPANALRLLGRYFYFSK